MSAVQLILHYADHCSIFINYSLPVYMQENCLTVPPTLEILISLVTLRKKPHTLSIPLAPLFQLPVTSCLPALQSCIYQSPLLCIENLLKAEEESLIQCCNPHLLY